MRDSDAPVDVHVDPAHPLRIGVAGGGRSWANCPGEFVRVTPCDLRDATHRVAAARERAPGLEVLIDIRAVIAADSHTARALAHGRAGDPGLLYVGTPAGLAGLVVDIHTLRIADGAMLIPASSEMRVLIEKQVLPALAALAGPAAAEARPA